MRKLILTLLLVVALIAPAYAYRVDTVRVTDVDGALAHITSNHLDVNTRITTSVSSGSVTIREDECRTAVQLTRGVTAANEDIANITLYVDYRNDGDMFIGNSEVSCSRIREGTSACNGGFMMTVTAGRVKLQSYYLSNLYVSGEVSGDTIYFIIDTVE